MDTETLIDLIAIGLPNYVSDKIDRETLQETQDLYNEINKLEHLVKKNFNEKKENLSWLIKKRKVNIKIHVKYVKRQTKGSVSILNQSAGLEKKKTKTKK